MSSASRGSGWWSPISDRSLRSLPPSLLSGTQATLVRVAGLEGERERRAAGGPSAAGRARGGPAAAMPGEGGDDELLLRRMGWRRREAEADAEGAPYVDGDDDGGSGDDDDDGGGGGEAESDGDRAAEEELDAIIERADAMGREISRLQLEVRNSLYRSIAAEALSPTDPSPAPPARATWTAAGGGTSTPGAGGRGPAEGRPPMRSAAGKYSGYSLRSRRPAALDGGGGGANEKAFSDENAAPRPAVVAAKRRVDFGEGRRPARAAPEPLGDAANALLPLMAPPSVHGDVGARGGGHLPGGPARAFAAWHARDLESALGAHEAEVDGILARM